MSTVVVVGSGPTGVHIAQTLLDRGLQVTMLDVGTPRPPAVNPEQSFEELKSGLADPVDYFLGSRGESVVFPTEQAAYYSFPPSKRYVFEAPDPFAVAESDFEPVISFAAGGLAEAWTAGCYPLNDSELAEFPFDYKDLEPFYQTIIRRIGVTAANDDLARFSAWFDNYLEPLATDPHSSHILAQYSKKRRLLNDSLNFYLGRSRVGVLSDDLGDRQACSQLGRCLWGCPRQSLYAPSSTLETLKAHPGFTYVSGAFVTHFEYEDGKISGLLAEREDGGAKSYSADNYVLAAGALCSSKIFLDSIYRRTGEVHELVGLMDNLQVMLPFLSFGMIGRSVTTSAYQFHQLALGVERPRADEYVHGQITCLKSAAVHPVVQGLPLDLRSALSVFRTVHSALGAANIWFHDRRSDDNVLTIRPVNGSKSTELVLQYSSSQRERAPETIAHIKRALRKLGCFAPPGMTKVLSNGASIHYAGTMPMSSKPQSFASNSDCQSYDFPNLYLADGATFPFLPAKNLTFTLMANAARIGEAIAA